MSGDNIFLYYFCMQNMKLGMDVFNC